LVGPVAAAEPAADAFLRVVEVEVHALVEVRLGAELVHVLVFRIEAYSHGPAPYLTAQSSDEATSRRWSTRTVSGVAALRPLVDGSTERARPPRGGAPHPATPFRSTAARHPARPTKHMAPGWSQAQSRSSRAIPSRYSSRLSSSALGVARFTTSVMPMPW